MYLGFEIRCIPLCFPLHFLAMRRTSVLFGSVLMLLAACGGSVHVTYKLQFNTEDPGRKTLLSLAVTRVVERRLENMGEKVKGLDITQGTDGPELSFSLDKQSAAEALQADLLAPFTLRIMREAKKNETPTIAIEGQGGFIETGITEGHLVWTDAAEEPGNKGRITLSFNDDGRKRMAKVFKENVGKSIGLFVRNHLVAKLQVDTAELKDDIIISGIPSVDLAHVFADDVNVGLHVTFIPVP